MQIQKIQCNDVKTSFSANLKIKGAIEDITSRQLKSWGKKAQSVGCETDIIELEFGQPINTDVLKKIPKPTNPKFIGSWRRCIWRLFGIYPLSNSDTLLVSRRNIKASATFKNNYSENIGYWCDYYTKVEDKDIQKWHTKTTKNCVNDYFSRLVNSL